jgi:hypothetical protein
MAKGPPKKPMVKVDTDPCAWTEVLYRAIVHYAWEPQHKRHRTVREFLDAIRHHEVPLNLLLYLLLRWSPPHTVRRLLKPFGIDPSVVQLGDLRVTCPSDRIYTQPDLCLESDMTRIFIEVKVGSKTGLPQVQKYLLLHADEDNRHGVQKTPYLLFLTQVEFVKHWSPHTAAAGDVHDFLRATTKDAGIGTFAKGANRQLLERYDEVKATIQYGAATWKSVGGLLVRVCEEYQQAGRHDTDIRIISDFITELRQRDLMPKPA